MLKQEEKMLGGNKFIHTYSDKGFYILQVETNVKYDEAYDVIPCKYTYVETEEKIEREEEPSETL